MADSIKFSRTVADKNVKIDLDFKHDFKNGKYRILILDDDFDTVAKGQLTVQDNKPAPMLANFLPRKTKPSKKEKLSQ